jgi:hypothetical protein
MPAVVDRGGGCKRRERAVSSHTLTPRLTDSGDQVAEVHAAREFEVVAVVQVTFDYFEWALDHRLLISIVSFVSNAERDIELCRGMPKRPKKNLG